MRSARAQAQLVQAKFPAKMYGHAQYGNSTVTPGRSYVRYGKHMNRLMLHLVGVSTTLS